MSPMNDEHTDFRLNDATAVNMSLGIPQQHEIS